MIRLPRTVISKNTAERIKADPGTEDDVRSRLFNIGLVQSVPPRYIMMKGNTRFEALLDANEVEAALPCDVEVFAMGWGTRPEILNGHKQLVRASSVRLGSVGLGARSLKLRNAK